MRDSLVVYEIKCCVHYFLLMLFLFVCLFLEGKRHDSAVMAESNLLNDLRQYGMSPTSRPMCIYGDPAYPLRVQLQTPFRNVHMTPHMQAFNQSVSQIRSSVQWIFSDIVNYFKFIDFKKNLKITEYSWKDVYCKCSAKKQSNLPVWKPNFSFL